MHCNFNLHNTRRTLNCLPTLLREFFVNNIRSFKLHPDSCWVVWKLCLGWFLSKLIIVEWKMHFPLPHSSSWLWKFWLKVSTTWQDEHKVDKCSNHCWQKCNWKKYLSCVLEEVYCCLYSTTKLFASTLQSSLLILDVSFPFLLIRNCRDD